MSGTSCIPSGWLVAAENTPGIRYTDTKMLEQTFLQWQPHVAVSAADMGAQVCLVGYGVAISPVPSTC